MVDDELAELDDELIDPDIAQDEVVSAARSCSVILIIGIALALLICAAFALTLAF